jgi:hypothetical protein
LEVATQEVARVETLMVSLKLEMQAAAEEVEHGRQVVGLLTMKDEHFEAQKEAFYAREREYIHHRDVVLSKVVQRLEEERDAFQTCEQTLLAADEQVAKCYAGKNIAESNAISARGQLRELRHLYETLHAAATDAEKAAVGAREAASSKAVHAALQAEAEAALQAISEKTEAAAMLAAAAAAAEQKAVAVVHAGEEAALTAEKKEAKAKVAELGREAEAVRVQLEEDVSTMAEELMRTLDEAPVAPATRPSSRGKVGTASNLITASDGSRIVNTHCSFCFIDMS